MNSFHCGAAGSWSCTSIGSGIAATVWIMVSTAGTAMGVAWVSKPCIANPGMFLLGMLTVAGSSEEGWLLKTITRPADSATAAARCPRGMY